MSRFSYQAILSNGHRVNGTVRSRDAREAVRRLLEMGYHPLAVQPASGRGPSAFTPFRRRVPARDVAVFTRQLSSLLKAGLPVVRAIQTLRQQTDRARLVRILQEIEEAISRDGGTLSEAMDEYPDVFDPVYRGLIRSGEEAGNLVEVLRDLAEQLSASVKLRGQVVGAFVYPAFLLFIGTVAVFILVSFVIPKFEVMFQSFSRQLPWPTRALIAISGFMSNWWWAVLLVGFSILAMLGILLRRPGPREKFDAAILRMPVIGPLLLRLELARISRTLAALLAGGIRIVEAVRATADTVGNRALRRTFEPIARGLTAGETLASGLEKTGMYPPLVINLVRTGEETGELPEMLNELATIYRDESERAVTGAVRLLEPMLILIMGGIIAGIVAAVILPIFQANMMVE